MKGSKGLLIVGAGLVGLYVLSKSAKAEEDLGGYIEPSGGIEGGFDNPLGGLLNSFLAPSSDIPPMIDDVSTNDTFALSKKSTGEQIGLFSGSQLDTLGSGGSVSSGGSIFKVESFGAPSDSRIGNFYNLAGSSLQAKIKSAYEKGDLNKGLQGDQLIKTTSSSSGGSSGGSSSKKEATVSSSGASSSSSGSSNSSYFSVGGKTYKSIPKKAGSGNQYGKSKKSTRRR